MRFFDYDRRLIPNLYLASLDADVNNPVEVCTGVSLGYPGWNFLYYSLFTSLRQEEYNTVIETGTNWGFSTICLAQAIKDSKFKGKVHSVEQNQDHIDKAKANIKAAKLEAYVKLYQGKSKRFLMEFLPTLEGPPTFTFLDSNHDAKHVFEEFKILYPFLDDTSIVFFDNTSFRPNDKQEVYEGIVMILKEFGGNIVNFPNTSWGPPGQAIWQKDPFKILLQ